MSVNFDCIAEDHDDRHDFMFCLDTIKHGYENSSYVDVDDICNFMREIKGTLFEIIEKLNSKQDSIGLSYVLEKVFSIILLIHNRTKEKVDLLEEFNTIHEILEEYEEELGNKIKLKILKQVQEQCKIYYSRPVDVLEKAKEKRQEDRISLEDYSFLKE